MTLALLLLALSPAAQDGGRVNWIGKGKDPVESVFDDAKKAQQPLVLFFSREGDADCKAVCDGAFSDQDVLAETRRLTCIFVDCGRDGKKNASLTKSLKVRKFPTILLCDPQGHLIAEVQHFDAPGMTSALRALTETNEGVPPFSEDVAGAFKNARTKNLPLLIYFYDDSPPSISMNKSLNDPELKTLHSRFLAAKAPMQKDSALCRQLDVTRAPTILVLDPRQASSAEKPLSRISVTRSPHELRRDLDEALDAARGAGIGKSEAAPEEPVKPSAPPEKLSDDEVDRKFIRARFTFAIDLIKQGKKDKAIDVLEDVARTFPRHVETLAVKKYLDELKAQK